MEERETGNEGSEKDEWGEDSQEVSFRSRWIDRLLQQTFTVGSVTVSGMDLIFMTCLWMGAMMLRLQLFPIESADYFGFLHPWMEEIREAGIWPSMGMQISNYAPPYMYLMCIAAALTGNDLFSLKAISVLFDFAASVAAFGIVHRLTGNTRRAVCAMALLLLCPAVVLDGAYWCQCDIIYTCFLLYAIYFLVRGSSRGCLICVGISFAFKLQAVFLLPFLVILWLKDHVIRLRHFLYLPIMYVIGCIPALFAGRSAASLLGIYLNQSNYYPWGTLEYPNLYAFLDEIIPNSHHADEIGAAGLMFAILLLGLLAYILYEKRFSMNGEVLVTLALFSVQFTVYTMPHMHERYGFLADLLAVLYAVLRPSRCYISCGIFLVTTLSYMPYLIAVHVVSLPVLAAVQLVLIILVAMDLRKLCAA